jgi:hypothetical protein
MGDYLDFSYNPIVKGILLMGSVDERISFADKAKVIFIRGKKGILKSITSAFSKPEDISSPRFLMLTQEAVYSFVFEADPETGKTRAKMYFRVPLEQLTSVTASSLQDNFFVMHFAPQAGTTDTFQSCKRKTEFLGLVVENYKQKTGRTLSITFADTDNVTVVKKNKPENVNIKFVRDETCPEEKVVTVRENFEVHVATGTPSGQVPEPYRPPDVDPNAPVRDQLQAVYDFNGNGIDELTFHTGDVISVIDPESDGWYRGELNGKKGYVPASYVTVIAGGKKKAGGPAAGHAAGPAAGRGGAGGKMNQLEAKGGGYKPGAPAALPGKAIKPKKSGTFRAWEKVLDEDSGQHYFYNKMTGQSTWDTPSGYNE